ncbi:glycoside hydrolase family protein [Hymenobacter sp. HMF4947]|uniref:Lysozyme n=1 Tax=Hymenobacter ginkgonis TaxID=2682976 RepID=A0A7K1TCD2_9BACT|nr:lysozyme [Hymenobacter ginkgonis]MVN75831.1 glycoside hydrolase family protein [Hymenobacter ginkgonis]
MKISEAGLALIKREEAFRASWYRCEAGRPTIGYGHVIQKGEERYYTVKISEAEASTLLRQDVDKQYGAHVASRVHRDVTQHQFDAMVSLCYNIGTGGFDKSSVLALANAGASSPTVIKTAFGLWNKVTDPNTKLKRVSPGLTARRSREAALYLQP